MLPSYMYVCRLAQKGFLTNSLKYVVISTYITQQLTALN